MDCPKCGKADMWDNRETKKNPKAPDYKCRDANCDGVVWPPKGGKAAIKATKPAPVGRDMGPHVPGLDDGDPGPYEDVVAKHATPASEKSTAIYLTAMKFVIDTVVPVWEAGKIPYTADSINAATATIMIDYQRRSGR